MTTDYIPSSGAVGVEPKARVTSGSAESAFSGVSWAAIIAGAVGAAAITILLLTLGTGLGLVSVSPWEGEGASSTAIGIGTIIWLILTEVIAFGLGGYLAGRLRTKWVNVRGDEGYFRDTAHGFTTWALGTLLAVFIATSALGSLARGTAEVGAAAAGGLGGGLTAMLPAVSGGQNSTASRGDRNEPTGYFIDMLLRPGSAGQPAGGQPSGNAAGGNTAANRGDDTAQRREVGRIMIQSFATGSIAQPDKTYLGQLISTRTGLSQQDAEKRIDDVLNQAKKTYDDAAQKVKEAADAARKAGAGVALWSCLAMLIGACSASYAATLGGRARDL